MHMLYIYRHTYVSAHMRMFVLIFETCTVMYSLTYICISIYENVFRENVNFVKSSAPNTFAK